MDLRQFGIDERLLAGAPWLNEKAPFLVKMLSHALVKGENVCARLALSEDREAAYLLPAIQWLASGPAGEKRRVLGLCDEGAGAERMASVAREIGTGIGLEAAVIRGGAAGASADASSPASSVPLVFGTLDALLAASAESVLDLASFGYLIIDRGERIAELPGEKLRKFSSALKPSWERKVIVACDRIGAKAKNLAWDFSDNPVEVQVEEGAAKAQSILQETWHLGSEEKLRFLLGLLARRRPRLACVFCNLKSGAEELALRLRYNGVDAEYILGALPREKKLALLSDLDGAEGSVLVLTDEGAEGLPEAHFPLVVSFDIPLDPELYVKRISMLDQSLAGASVLNLACERYVYGLPAVEQFIDAKLDARPVDAEMLKAEDKSSGLVFERPRFDDEGDRGGGRGSRSGRLVPAAGAIPAGRPDGENRQGDSREGSFHQGRSQSGGRGHGEGGNRGNWGDRGRADHSPAIRQSIADITGGSLDVDALPSPGRESRPAGGVNRGDRGDRARGGGKPGGSHESRKPGSQGHKGEGHGQSAGGRRKAGQGARIPPAGSGRGKPEATRAGLASGTNPYELSMEERMARYREKYAGSSNAGQGKNHENSKQGTGNQGMRASDKSRAVQNTRQGHADAQVPNSRKPEGRAPAGKAVAQAPEDRKAEGVQGFWNRLFGPKKGN